jgi:hypothetical protein
MDGDGRIESGETHKNSTQTAKSGLPAKFHSVMRWPAGQNGSPILSASNLPARIDSEARFHGPPIVFMDYSLSLRPCPNGVSMRLYRAVCAWLEASAAAMSEPEEFGPEGAGPPSKQVKFTGIEQFQHLSAV